MEAAGMIQVKLEAKLSPGPPLLSLRRHGDLNRWHEVGSRVATGNFMAAKRRGLIDGIDYGLTGEVKKINVSRIRERLDKDSIVIVSNLGYSSTGEVLNCNTYEVASYCALALEADKLICITPGHIVDEKGFPIRLISLQEPNFMSKNKPMQSETPAIYENAGSENYIHSFNFESVGSDKIAMDPKTFSLGNNAKVQNRVGVDNCGAILSSGQRIAVGGDEQMNTFYFSALAAAAFVCKRGVRRVHIVDGTCVGALLLELFTRDGRGTMISGNVY